MIDPSMTEGECVCCRAASDILWTPDNSEIEVPLCAECRDDGTFKAWLEAQLQITLVEMGFTFETRDGIEYAIRPKTV